MLVDGFVAAGRTADAETLLAHLSPTAPPNRVVFNTLLRGYAALGPSGALQVLALLNRMRAAGCAPEADTYTTLIAAAVAAPDHGSAAGLFGQMVGDGFAPDAVALTCLMRVFVDSGQTDKVLEVRGIAAATRRLKRKPAVLAVCLARFTHTCCDCMQLLL